ncbi:MAG TPA: acyltransferase [Puia sp.]|nr:acyltransferase [Puia sp.]
MPEKVLPTLSASRRLLYLDSARGLAAVSVVFWHSITAFFPFERPSFAQDSPFHFFWYGDADVTFFFIHSGFILTYTNRQFLGGLSGGDYARFLVSRAFRIYPLFLFVLLLSHILATTVYPISGGQYLTSHFHQFWNFHKSWGDVAREALLVVRIPGNDAERYMPQDWTLSVELIASAFLPLLSWLMKKNSWICCVLIFLLARIPGLSTFVLEFGAGVFLYHFADRIKVLWNRLNRAGHYAIVTLALVCYTCVFHFSDYLGNGDLFLSQRTDRLIVMAGCVLIFILLLNSARLQKILSGRVWVRIGEVCYGIYLFHLLLLIVCGDYLLQFLAANTFFSLWVDKVIVLLLVQALSIGLAFFSFFAVERPMIRLGKRLTGAGKRQQEKRDRRYEQIPK